MAEVKNFQSKSARKKYRKGLVRGYIANKAGEIKEGFESRSQFYRTLRIKKQNRHRVAAALGRIAPEIDELRGMVERWSRRSSYPDQDLVDTAVRQLNRVSREAAANAAEYRTFAHQRIYYRKDAVTAA